MSSFDKNFRLKKRVKLNVAAIYLPTYNRSGDLGRFDQANELLDKHNMELKLWPTRGRKTKLNTLDLELYKEPIKHTKAAYKQLRKDVNSRIKRWPTGYPFLVPVIFCRFDYDAKAITPHSSRFGVQAPACLVSPRTCTDKMTVLHEMGHSALYPDARHLLGEKHRGNLMHEAEGRKYIYKYQVEVFSKAFFAQY